MAAMQERLQSVFQHFVPGLSESILLQDPQILAIIVGGNWLYLDDADIKAGIHRLYWNVVVLVKTKLDIFKLVNENRQRLLDITGIVREECPSELFKVPSPDSEYWSEFNAVGFSGYDRLSSMRSVTIMSWDSFIPSTAVAIPTTAFNIFSYMDKRVSKNNNLGHVECQIIQASSLPNGFVILHDQWLFEDWRTPYDSRRDPLDVVFGPAAEVLACGVDLFKNPFREHLTQRVLLHYFHVTGIHVSAKRLTDSDLFSSSYTAWVDERLEQYYNALGQQVLPSLALGNVSDSESDSHRRLTLFGDTSTGKYWDRKTFSTIETVDEKVLKCFERGDFAWMRQRRPLSGELSGKWEVAITCAARNTTNVLCKTTPSAKDELERATVASHFYPWVQVPRISGSERLLFPMLEYEYEEEIRARYYKNEGNSWKDAEVLIHAEVVKAEIILSAYRKAFRNPNIQRQDTRDVIKSYLDRVARGGRLFRELHGKIQVKGGRSIDTRKFLDLEWIINGERYPSLRKLLDQAAKDIHKARSSPVVIGLGDTSALHTMVSPRTAQGGRKVIFDNYDSVKYHPVMLDIARTFYFDVFSEMARIADLPSRMRPWVRYSITETAIEVKYARNRSWLAQTMADIKIRYLLHPLEDEIKAMGHSFDDLIPQLSAGIFLVPTLYQDFSKNPDYIITNVMTGIVMSRCRNWGEFDLALAKLGFHP
ncbi:hypothetical protein F5Y00DRAFT_251795 [Daldinia vernicosa]|uniref:uncharacterized protein n=1 Tax=Daldinia vernicosa TaxID=114800 RepID=UPI0020078504|nr:uncharacterized protein F5Y00DRAFT_251795 [Daldinia vernicosa]KAI0851132.1 hypothetical protein F5Y00DRAFT_251795 [Daldinia vernicosa]